MKSEKKTKIGVITFGRFNPPTIGHEKLVDKVRTYARLSGGDAMIFLSHTQDAKKNPLDYSTKFKHATKAFGKAVKRSNSRTIIQILQELESKYTEIVLVVGSDRVEKMGDLVKGYNGIDYHFNKISTTSAGTRDPDAEGVEGMSATKMRAAAKDYDIDTFMSGLPRSLKSNADQVLQDVRLGMKIK